MAFRILWFVLCNVLGFLSISAMFYGAYFLDRLPTVPETGENFFRSLFFGGTMWAWLGGFLISLGYFFVDKGARLFLLWAPVFLPCTYAAGIFWFFYV